MNIYKFIDYKKYVKKWVESQPKRGHGCFAKMAEAMQISSVLVSQIFNGQKDLSQEHAYLLTEFLDLTNDEKTYFLLLVNFERAGSLKLKNYYRDEINKIQDSKINNLKESVAQDINLEEADRALFYSNWLYSAIRLLTSIEGYQTPESIAEKLNLTREDVVLKLQWLAEKELCVRDKAGYKMGHRRTHLEATSPYIKQRQVSWRVKGFEKMESPKVSQMFYTAPMSISHNQYDELKQKVTELIAELNKKIVLEKPDKLACLNIDLFEV